MTRVVPRNRTRRGTPDRGAAARCVALLFVVSSLVLPLGAQKKKKEGEDKPPEIDPYTQADPAAMAKAGYVSFGPFPWADGHDTKRIEEVLGGIYLLWVETEHFRLGMCLPEYKVPGDKEEKKLIRADLEELAEKLPNVNPKTKKIDPWLRLHLYAHRLEKLYDRFTTDFGLEPADFPAEAGKRVNNVYMGEGPYLGMPEKFTVLLTEKGSSFSRYTQNYMGINADVARRWGFHRTGTMFFGTAKAFFEGPYDCDNAFYTNVVFGVTHNLVDGFRAFLFETPLWFKEGLATVYSREIDERWNVYGGSADKRALKNKDWEWAPRVRGRVNNDVYPKAEDMFAWLDPNALKDSDHMMLWSRTEYLMQLGDPEKLRAFLLAYCEPPGVREPDALAAKTAENQRKALLDGFGLTVEEFDRQWAEWVLDKYPKR